MSSELLKDFVDDLDAALGDYIETERERITTERDFLQNVLEGRADGVTVEDVSTDLTKKYLEGYLGTYIAIEKDVSTSSS